MVKTSLAVRLLQRLCYHLSFRHNTGLSGSVRLTSALLCCASWDQPPLTLAAKQACERRTAAISALNSTEDSSTKKKNLKKLSQKQLPCQPLHNPVYLSHMLCKSISLLNSTDSTSNLLKREQDTMNIFWSDTVQYSWPFFPTAVMLQMHFM